MGTLHTSVQASQLADVLQYQPTGQKAPLVVNRVAMIIKFAAGTKDQSLLHQAVMKNTQDQCVDHSLTVNLGMKYTTQKEQLARMNMEDSPFVADQKLTMELNIIVLIKIAKRQLIRALVPQMEMRSDLSVL